jgi:hypothetical protein
VRRPAVERAACGFGEALGLVHGCQRDGGVDQIAFQKSPRRKASSLMGSRAPGLM